MFADTESSGSSGLSDVIAAAKETGAALQQTIQQTAVVAGQAVAIVGTATTVVKALTPNGKLP